MSEAQRKPYVKPHIGSCIASFPGSPWPVEFVLNLMAAQAWVATNTERIAIEDLPDPKDMPYFVRVDKTRSKVV